MLSILLLMLFPLSSIIVFGLLDRRFMKIPIVLLLPFIALSILTFIGLFNQPFLMPYLYLTIIGGVSAIILSSLLAPNLADYIVFLFGAISWGPFGIMPLILYSTSSIWFARKDKGKEHPALWRFMWCCIIAWIAILILQFAF